MTGFLFKTEPLNEIHGNFLRVLRLTNVYNVYKWPGINVALFTYVGLEIHFPTALQLAWC